MAASAFALSTLLAAVPGGASACALEPADGQRIETGTVQLAWRAEPAEILGGRPFALTVRLCPVQAELTAVDAAMPEHRHGMNYRPSLKPLGDGRWRVEGLLWHMSGRWELRFGVRHDGQTLALRQDVVLR